jgi:thiamine-phosphate pyrophosphorylase
VIPLDRFYPIVENAAWVERLVRHGARLVQLRMKDRPDEIIREHVRAARTACEDAGAQLVVNDHWRIAIEEACDFVHLGQEDLDDADLPALRKAGIRLGVSTHDHAELERAVRLKPDYIALGPIYPTLLKKMPWAPQGLERIGEWKRLIGDTPLVAIGGLTVERLPLVFGAGADVAAVVTDIVRSADPAARTRQWLAATRAVH